MRKKIHPGIRAGRTIPFSVIIYKPFVKEELSYEITEYIKRSKGRVYYATNTQELKKLLKKFKTQANLL